MTKAIEDSGGKLSAEDFVELGINDMMDWTKDEMKTMLGDLSNIWDSNQDYINNGMDDGIEVVGGDDEEEVATNENGHPEVKWPGSIPKSVDWRDEGVVTEVKDQGSCGSCWAFASAGVMESAYAIAAKKSGDDLIELAEQQILDCVHADINPRYRSMKCNGGFMSEAFEFAQTSYITERKKYPYRGKGKECRMHGSMTEPTEEQKTWIGKKFDKITGKDQNPKELEY